MRMISFHFVPFCGYILIPVKIEKYDIFRESCAVYGLISEQL